MRRRWRDSPVSLLALAATFVLVVVLLGAIALPALGGDRSTVVYTDPEEYVVAPGDTLEMQILMNSDGGYDNVGLETMTMTASYDPTHLTATAVEPGSYMERGNETEVNEETNIDTETGTVTVKQWRDPPRGGAVGNDRFATVTFEIAPDAPETNTTVSFEDSRGALVGEYDVFVFPNNATISIDEDAPKTRQATGTGESSDGTGLSSGGRAGIAVLLVTGVLALVGVVAMGVRRFD